MKEIIVITGPTASGKTKVSIELANMINGEIISADSMQVYKYMNIGTAKPDKNEMKGIKHYLIDEIFPDENFNVVMYKKRAEKYIEYIISKGKFPLITGGTGQYIDSLVYNIKYCEMETDKNIRSELEKIIKEKGNEYLYKKLEIIDKEAAGKIHINNTRRIIRALEVYEQTGKTFSKHNEESMKEPPKYSYLMFGLYMDRDLLYSRINKRVDEMIEKGLTEEVKSIIDLGYGLGNTAVQGLGYKEIIWYLNGRCTLDEAVNLLKRNTRRYAKRQMTWFNRTRDIKWIDSSSDTPQALALKIYKCIATHNDIL